MHDAVGVRLGEPRQLFERKLAVGVGGVEQGQALGAGQVAGEFGPPAEGIDRRRTVDGLYVRRARGGGGRVRCQFFQDRVYPRPSDGTDVAARALAR